MFACAREVWRENYRSDEWLIRQCDMFTCVYSSVRASRLHPVLSAKRELNEAIVVTVIFINVSLAHDDVLCFELIAVY